MPLPPPLTCLPSGGRILQWGWWFWGCTPIMLTFPSANMYQGSRVPRFQGSKVGNPNSCQGDSLLLCSGAGGFVAVHQSCCNQQVCAKIINKYVQVLAINHNQSNHVLISSQGWEPQLLHLPPALSPQGDDLQCSGAWCHGWLHTNHVHAILLAMCQSHHQKVAHTQ